MKLSDIEHSIKELRTVTDHTGTRFLLDIMEKLVDYLKEKEKQEEDNRKKLLDRLGMATKESK